MSRSRQVKPDFFLNEGLAVLPPMTRLLFIGLWTLADREGRVEDRPGRIKAQLFPYHDADVDTMLTELARGFLDRYCANEIPCLQIVNFKKHQHVHPDEKASVLPANPEIPGDFKNKQGIKSCSSSPSSSTSPSTTLALSLEGSVPESPGILEFPTVGSGPKTWWLHQEKVDEWSKSYPGVDVITECRKARQWVIDRPAKRKTFSGMTRFLGSWMSREQDRGPKATYNGNGGHQGGGTGNREWDIAEAKMRAEQAREAAR